MKFKKSPVILLLLICLCLEQLPAISQENKKYVEFNEPNINYINGNDDENKTRFNEIIPNPVIYLYGRSTNNEPIFLMAFSSAIPVVWLENKLKPVFLKRTFEKKLSDLDSVILKLKINPKYGYYYKILQISADQVTQRVGYSDSLTKLQSTSASFSQPTQSGGTGRVAGLLGRQTNESSVYDMENPILVTSGVGSDTLTITLRRGKKYPIPNGQIRAYMLVRGIKESKIQDFKTAKLDALIQKISGGNFCLKDITASENITDKNGYDIKKATNVDELTKNHKFEYLNANDFIKSLTFKYLNRADLIKDLCNKEKSDINAISDKKMDSNYNLNKNANDFVNSITKSSAINFINKSQLLDNSNSGPKKENSCIKSCKKKEKSCLTSTTSNKTNTSKANFKNIISFYETDALGITKTLPSDLFAFKNKFPLYIKAAQLVKNCDNCTSKYYVTCNDNSCCSSEFFNRTKFDNVIDLHNEIKLLDKAFEQTKAKDIDDFITKIKIKKIGCSLNNADDFINAISADERIKSVDDLKGVINRDSDNYNDSYLYYKDEINRITGLYDDVDLTALVKDVRNNVDLDFDKTIYQDEKRTMGKSWIMNWWFPPVISKGIILPIGLLLYPAHEDLNAFRADDNNIKTSKIIMGTYFDKDFKEHINDGVADGNGGYIRDDDKINAEMIDQQVNHNILLPTISSPTPGATITAP